MPKKKHQFIIFVESSNINFLESKINDIATHCGVEVSVLVRNNKNEQTAIEIANHGDIAGKEWRDYNQDKYLLVTAPRSSWVDDDVYLFHMSLAKILNCDFETLVGYKPYKGARIEKGQHIWREYCISHSSKNSSFRPTLPTRLSDPIYPIFNFLNKNGLKISATSIAMNSQHFPISPTNESLGEP
jgi:hypothetical protein